MAKNVNISTSDLKAKVLEQLGFLGKRLKDAKGTSQYPVVLPSSIEDGVFKQFVASAVAHISSDYSAYLEKAYSVDVSNTISLQFNKDDWNVGMSTMFEYSVIASLVSYVVYEILSIYLPDYAKKYLDDLTIQQNDMKRHFFSTTPPIDDNIPLSNCTGSVTLSTISPISPIN